MRTVTAVRVHRRYVLDVKFDDGSCRRVDVEPLLFGEAFEPLRDPRFFRKVSVDPELGTIIWPNGADISPEYLYGEVEAATVHGPVK